MDNYDELKSEIINSTLKKIYRSKKPFSEFPFEGLGILLTYRFIMELDNGKKYAFNRDHLWKWDNSEKIIELETKFKKNYENKRILDIIDVDDIYFKIEMIWYYIMIKLLALSSFMKNIPIILMKKGI